MSALVAPIKPGGATRQGLVRFRSASEHKETSMRGVLVSLVSSPVPIIVGLYFFGVL